MQDILKIACIQPDIIWEDNRGNIQKYDKLIDSISNECNLLILPEMFATGFSMNPKNGAEIMNGKSISWMKKIATERNIAIMGSLIIVENKKYYNRLIFVHPSGALEFYDKRHLFTLAGEEKVYTSGNKKLIVNYKGWKICPMICYDLRFPVWSRNDQDYDVLIYVANWPKPRINTWDTLLKARAIENMSYTIGVNRIGKDANNYEYVGHSQIIDMFGNEIAKAQQNRECTVEVLLNKDELISGRKKFQFLNDKDSFSIEK